MKIDLYIVLLLLVMAFVAATMVSFMVPILNIPTLIANMRQNLQDVQR